MDPGFQLGMVSQGQLVVPVVALKKHNNIFAHFFCMYAI
jgi:hypothetical protein